MHLRPQRLELRLHRLELRLLCHRSLAVIRLGPPLAVTCMGAATVICMGSLAVICVGSLAVVCMAERVAFEPLFEVPADSDTTRSGMSQQGVKLGVPQTDTRHQTDSPRTAR